MSNHSIHQITDQELFLEVLADIICQHIEEQSKVNLEMDASTTTEHVTESEAA